jgi:hypothetical protein
MPHAGVALQSCPGMRFARSSQFTVPSLSAPVPALTASHLSKGHESRSRVLRNADLIPSAAHPACGKILDCGNGRLRESVTCGSASLRGVHESQSDLLRRRAYVDLGSLANLIPLTADSDQRAPKLPDTCLQGHGSLLVDPWSYDGVGDGLGPPRTPTEASTPREDG